MTPRLFLLFFLLAHACAQDIEPDLMAGGGMMDLEPLGSDIARAPEHPAPGFSPGIVCFAAPDTVYDLYLPPAYTERPNDRFPLLLIQNPGGRPETRQYLAWAEQRGVILVGLHKVDNGMLQHLKPRHWRAFLQDLEARGVRFENGLLVAVGMSGGSADGERFTRSFPDYACGTVAMGVCNVARGANRRHIATAVFLGGKDPFQGTNSQENMFAAQQEWGLVLRVHRDIGRRHTAAPMSEQIPMLEWLFDLGRLRSPLRSPEQIDATRETFRQQMRATAAMPPGPERRAAATHWLALPPLRDLPEAAALRIVWAQDTLAAANAIADPRERLVFLREIPLDETGVLLSPEERQALDSAADALARDEAVVRAWQAWQELRRVEQHEWAAHLDKDAIARVDAEYEALVEAHPDTPAALAAAKARERLKRFR